MKNTRDIKIEDFIQMSLFTTTAPFHMINDICVVLFSSGHGILPADNINNSYTMVVPSILYARKYLLNVTSMYNADK